ncbi:MAG: J domain-containing protein [Labilithrix sp.]
MAEEPSASSLPRTPTVFVTDAAEESSRVADTLRAAGYAVVDVPLSLLVSRVQVQRPQVVLVDVDASGALDQLAFVRKLPGSGAIDFVYFGTGAGSVRNADDALTQGGSAFFLRPIDIGAVVRRLEALTGGPVARPEVRPSTPPPSMPMRSNVPPDRSSNQSLPAPGVRTPGPPLPMSVPSLQDLVDPPRSLSSFGGVSNELQQLLADAELRADAIAQQGVDAGPLPSPEEEIESVLPADVLASLDEPIEADEDEDHEGRPHTNSGEREGTGTHGAKPTTAGGPKHTTTAGRPISTNPGRPISTNPGRPASSHPKTAERPASENPTRDYIPSSRREPSLEMPVMPAPAPPPIIEPPSPRAAPPIERLESVTIATVGDPIAALNNAGQLPTRAGSEAPPQASSAAVVLLRPVEARRFVGEAIARRASGSLCFEHDRIVRRIVLREGDLVTAASGADRESLVCFLGARGDLPRDEVERLSGKIPPYGRHAGAALVAHGWLGQDQLWSALRSHAEWIVTQVLRLGGGTAQLEAEPPGRLRSEPSVFGASTGCEIFVELVRRAVSSEEAIAALGGEGARIGDGARSTLLGECALPPAEIELITRGRGGTVADLLARSSDPDVASVVHALALLGVLDVMPAIEPSRKSDRDVAREVIALDDEAIRARVRARMELVDEGDYFSLLGVSRDATSYEVRRAFIELRRAFEPTKILSPRLHDLVDDVKKIVVVLEEAYEILRDVARRERYRRAIDASPDR